MKNSSPYNVILISVDAVAQPDAEKLLSLPAFRYLTENGVYTDDMQSVFPTTTYPTHTSAITGCYPDRHNIFHNEPWQADVPDDLRKWFWEIGDIGPKTLWEAASEKGNKVASMLWPVSGKGTGKIRWDFPELMPLRGESPIVKYFKYATKTWLAYTEVKWGKKVRKSISRRDMDDYMCFLAERLIEKKRVPELITIHFADTDFTRHDYGVGTKEDEEAVVRANAWVQRLFEAIKKRGLLEKTVFVVMSDHGQENVVNGYFPLDEKLCEAGIGRAQSNGMSAYIYADDTEMARQYMEARKSELHIDRIITDDELTGMHAPKGIKLAVIAEDGYGYVDRNCRCDHKGDHGFGMERKSARTLLWLCGEPFKKNEKINNVSVTDIAPTISKIMGLDMPDCDGRVLEEAMKK